jgi:protein subunit release factor B
VELRFNVEEADWLPMDIRTRLANQQRHKMNKDGELVISSQEHRSVGDREWRTKGHHKGLVITTPLLFGSRAHTTCDPSRTQMKNRDDCIRKLEHMLAEAAIVPKVRKMRVGLTEAAKQNRLHDKKMRSQTKALRRGKSSFDD